MHVLTRKHAGQPISLDNIDSQITYEQYK